MIHQTLISAEITVEIVILSFATWLAPTVGQFIFGRDPSLKPKSMTKARTEI